MTTMDAMNGLLWRGLADVPADWPACAVTIGVFAVIDGAAHLSRRAPSRHG